MTRVSICELPHESQLRRSLARIEYIDSFAVPLVRTDLGIVGIYAAALDHLPDVFKHLLVLRSMIVRPLGIGGVSRKDLAMPIDANKSYAVGDKIGRWTIYRQSAAELITGADDKHLDFASLSFETAADGSCFPRRSCRTTHSGECI